MAERNPAHPVEETAGLVERVTFHSEESGFAVLRVKARGHRELITVIGTVPNITAGEWIEASGRWVIDPKHGQQFKASTLHTTQPDTLEGIEKYLGSGLIKGIGPVYASKMVRKFGKTIFDIIDKESARLETIDGIGPQRRMMIKEAWKEQKVVREIMTFLFTHGVSTARAFRIYKTYGEEAIEKVRMDPYCLARDIRGIGFQSADKIAESLGIGRDSDLRARAGVEHVLQQVTDFGHCAFPREKLIEKAEEILGIPAKIIENAIEHGVGEDRLTQSPGPDGITLVYLKALDIRERTLARMIVHLSRGSHPLPPIDMEKAIAWVEGRISIKLDRTQHEALRSALTSKVMIITGGPGVGKTTLVNSILRILKAKKLHTVLCAPTGRAAKRLSETTGLQAKTIHRLLEFDPARGGFKRNSQNPLKGDVFIVDEASMIDLPLAHSLTQAIPSHAGFIIVGDVDQLPSVGPGCVLRDLIDSETVPVCRLTHIFRQAAESTIILNAHRVNNGKKPVYPDKKETEADPSDFFFIEQDDPEKASQLIVRLVRNSIPQRFGFHPLRDIQVLSPMQRGELGARNLNTLLQASLNPAGTTVERFGWKFRTGDKVMQLINDYDKDIFNGDIGRITAINEAEREMTVRFDRRDILYDLQELDELCLSYAATIHKSQGSEYPCVVIPIHTQHYILLQRNLLYTAITRGKRLVILVGSRKAMGIAVRKAEAHARITTLKERLIEAAS